MKSASALMAAAGLAVLLAGHGFAEEARDENPTPEIQSRADDAAALREKIAGLIAPASVILQQVSRRVPGDDRVSVRRLAVDLATGAQEEYWATLSDPEGLVFGEQALDVPLMQHVERGMLWGKGVRYRYVSETGTWSQFVRNERDRRLPMGFRSDYLRLDDSPEFKVRKASYEQLQASHGDDVGFREALAARLDELEHPGRRFEPEGFALTNADGRVFRMFLEETRRVFLLRDDRMIETLLVLDEADRVVERVDNRYVASHIFKFPAPREIGDIFPFGGANRDAPEMRVEGRAIGIRYARVGGAWIITTVSRDSPAALAGLQKGDVLSGLNGKNVSAKMMADELAALFDKDDVVDLVYLRDGSEGRAQIEKKTFRWTLRDGESIPFK